jgi:membrane protein YdbS with pleckstrin-like domain
VTEEREPTTTTGPAPQPVLVADGVDHSLHPNSVVAGRLGGGIAVAVIGGGSLIALLIVLLSTFPGPTLTLALLSGWLVVAVGLAAFAMLWPPVRYRHITYRVDEQGIRIRRGVVWRSEISVPRSRVQHTDVSRGPIDRSFGLATLVIYTAGTEHSSVSLGGLSAEAAQAVRDFLIEGGEGDAV